jgi:hypothetical protein
MKKTILVRNIESDVWNGFVGMCKTEGNNAGNELNKILKNILKK